MQSSYFYCISMCIVLFSFPVASANEMDASASIGQYPLGITQVFSEAGGIFKNFLSKMVANKKILGFNENWYLK